MPNTPYSILNKAPSRAEQFYRDLFTKRSVAFRRLNELVLEKAEENQWRDFKEAKFIYDPLPPEGVDNGKKHREEKKRRDDSVKELWSENLSAFANTGGGVLIWGIKASKHFAEEASLAGDANALAQRLIELQNDAVDPPIVGVDVRPVLKKGSPEGFVVCHIPESSFLPHRAMWAEREYYMRTGDSNRPIPTALLRRMFYPQFSPWIVPTVKAQLVVANREGDVSAFHNRDGLMHIAIEVKVANYGNASAQEVRIELEHLLHCQVQENIPNSLWMDGLRDNSGRDCKVTIHPGQTIPFLSYLTNRVGFVAPSDSEEFKLRFKIFAYNTAVLSSEVVFTGAELKNTVDSAEWLCRDAAPIA